MGPAVPLALDELLDVPSHLRQEQTHGDVGERQCENQHGGENDQCDDCGHALNSVVTGVVLDAGLRRFPGLVIPGLPRRLPTSSYLARGEPHLGR